MLQSREYWRENIVLLNSDSLSVVTRTKNRHWKLLFILESTSQLPVPDPWRSSNVFLFPSHYGMKVGLKMMGKDIIDFLMSFRTFEDLSFVLPPGLLFCAITRAIVAKNGGKTYN